MSWPVSAQPQAMLVSSEEADWSSGICGCCDDMKQCCFAFWCCPCFACITTRDFGQCLCLPLLDMFSCCIPPITMSMRASVRHRYGIRGSLCRDCVCSTCCLPCVWCQMSTEMKKGKLPTTLSDIIGRR
ncbi:cornifelin homolog B-like [Acanthochromis polyacanthus]|uniref:cornifelin homolog B-like n=1 Tax=Acanthochromis polyacanthus TaxID=80966 RepID=UPI0022345793|nr:cornifelin homolog B-like [Acanthochromis polyacanthus]